MKNRTHNTLPISLSLLGKARAAIVLPTCLAGSLLAQTNAVVSSGNLASANVSALSSGMPGASASISRVASGGETLHLLVGHSIFLNTKARLRRVYVADPAILNSYTLTPNQLIVTALVPGTSSVVILDELGQAQSYVFSSDIDVSNLRIAMSDAMRDDAVRVDGEGNRVTLSGVVKSDALAEQAVKLAGLYSKEVANSMTVIPAHEKQVRLKVRILEVDRSKLNQFGVNLFNPGGPYVSSSTTSQFPSSAMLAAGGPTINGVATNILTVSDPLNFLLYNAKYNIGVTVKDLENKQVLQILAEPTITTISGQKANFLAGGEFPFPVIQPGGAGAGSSVTIQFRPYGVKLEFTPFVNEDGTIRLKVSPEVSALDYTNAVAISGYTIPAISTRRAETQVELRSDQSFAISGLLDKRTTDVLGRTPGAANIPILGALFRSKSINRSTTELIVIVTPSVIDPLTDGKPPAELPLPVPLMDKDKFDKQFPGTHKQMSGQPGAPAMSSVDAPVDPGVATTPTEAVVATIEPPVTNVQVATTSTELPAAAPVAPVAAVSVAETTPVVSPLIVAASPTPVANPVPVIPEPVLAVAAPAPTPPAVQAAPVTPILVAADEVPAPVKPAAATPVREPKAVPEISPAQVPAPVAVASVPVPTIFSAAVPQPTAPASLPVERAEVTQPAAIAPVPAFEATAALPPATSTVDASLVEPPTLPLSGAIAHAPSVVQISALSHREDAESMVRALKRQGYDVAVHEAAGDTLLHLQMGPFASKADAVAMQARLLGEGYNATVR